MKCFIFFNFLLILIAGCDAPRRTRAPSQWINGSTLQDTGGGTFSPVTPGGTTTGTTTGTTGGTTPPTPGYENCNLAQNNYTVDIGYFGVCQNKQDEKRLKFNPSMTSSVRTCLIPTYKDSAGNSTYIGNPQCTSTTSNQVVEGQLHKDRPGFSGYPLNGLIVMKEPLLPEYFNCMQGYVSWPRNACPSGPTPGYCANWVPRCPAGGQSGPSCDTEARNYMASICNTFKSRYSNSYVDIRL